MNYLNKLKKSAQETGSIVCMGIDPVIEKIAPVFAGTSNEKNSIEGKIGIFYNNILKKMEETGTFPGMFKPNQGFFVKHDNSLGFDFYGSAALASIINDIKRLPKEIPFILDYKRGDIAKSSANYAVEGFENWKADAVTVSPYMGTDSVMPFAEYSKQGQGIYVLCRTSNDGAKDFQQLMVSGRIEIENGKKKITKFKEEKPVYMVVAEKIVEWNKQYDGVGAVVGATSPAELETIASYFEDSGKKIPLLIPGVGGQGGSAPEVMKILRKIYYNLDIVRINSSSGINFAYEKEKNLDYAEAAVRAIQKLNKEINF